MDAEVEVTRLVSQGSRPPEAGDERRSRQRLDQLLARHKVRVTHVLGHNGHPENEACDKMAVAAYKALQVRLPLTPTSLPPRRSRSSKDDLTID